MSVTEAFGGLTLDDGEWGTLNALVTYAMENMPGPPSTDMRHVAKVVGTWTLEGKLRPEFDRRPRSDNPGAAALGRDDAIARLCGRLTTLVDRELMSDELDYLTRAEAKKVIDEYIIDAVAQKRTVQLSGGNEVDPVTRIVHLDGGIDCLQEIREKLLGMRLDPRAIDTEVALRGRGA